MIIDTRLAGDTLKISPAVQFDAAVIPPYLLGFGLLDRKPGMKSETATHNPSKILVDGQKYAELYSGSSWCEKWVFAA